MRNNYSQVAQLFSVFYYFYFSSVNAALIIRTLFHNYIKNESPPQQEQGLVGWATCKYRDELFLYFMHFSLDICRVRVNILNPIIPGGVVIFARRFFDFTEIL